MSRMRRWWPYALVALVVAVLAGVEVLPRWPGLAHMVALPPLDVLADVRVLTAEASSPWVFALGVVASIVVRSAVLALVLGWSRATFAFALRFYVTVGAIALLAGWLDFAGRAVLYAYVLGVGVLLTILAVAFFAAVPWIGSLRLRDALRESYQVRYRLTALTMYTIVLTVVTLVAPSDGRGVIVAVPVSLVLTVFAAQFLSTRPPRLMDLEVILPISAAVLLVLAAAVRTATEDGVMPRPPARSGSLFLVSGVDTRSGHGAMYKMPPRALGYSCDQTAYFSYVGAGDGAPQGEAACAIRSGARYRKSDTLRPLRELRAAFSEQVAELQGPVVVVTHSQGAWIAWDAVARGEAPNVSAIVMLAPFAETLVAYPPKGEEGAGVVGGAVARVVSSFGHAIGFNDYDPNRPLPRELQATPEAAQGLFAQELPRGVRAISALSRWDLGLEPGAGPPGRVVCPGWANHGGLPRSVDTLRAIAQFLRGRDVDGCPRWTRGVAKFLASIGAPPPD